MEIRWVSFPFHASQSGLDSWPDCRIRSIRFWYGSLWAAARWCKKKRLPHTESQSTQRVTPPRGARKVIWACPPVLWRVCGDVEAVSFPVQNVYKMMYGDENATLNLWTPGPDRASALYMRKVQSKPTQAQVWNYATSCTRAGFEPVNGYQISVEK